MIQTQIQLSVVLAGWPATVAFAIVAVAALTLAVLILRFLKVVIFSERQAPARRLVRILLALAGLWSRRPPE